MSEMYSTATSYPSATSASPSVGSNNNNNQKYHHHQSEHNLNQQQRSVQPNSTPNNPNTFLQSIVQDYLLSPVLSHLSTTASILGQQQNLDIPLPSPPPSPTSPGSYPPSSSQSTDKLYEILYRSSRKLFGAPSMAYNCTSHQSAGSRLEEASQLLAGLALDPAGANLCAHPTTRATSAEAHEPNLLNKVLLFFMPAFSGSGDGAQMEQQKSTPTMPKSPLSAPPVCRDDVPSFPSLVQKLKRNSPKSASQMLDGEVTGPAHHLLPEVFNELLHWNMLKRSECKRSRSMSEVELTSMMKGAESGSPKSARASFGGSGYFRYSPKFGQNQQPSHAVDSCGEDSSSEPEEDVYEQCYPRVAESKPEVIPKQKVEAKSAPPPLLSSSSQQCSNFLDLDLVKNLFGGICQTVDSVVEPVIIKNNNADEQIPAAEPELKILQQDRQKRKEKQRKNRRRRTRKAKNKSSSDESDCKSSSCDDSLRDGDETSSDEIHYFTSLPSSPKSKSRGRGKKRAKANVCYQNDYDDDEEDDDLDLVFEFEDSKKSDPKSPKSPKSPRGLFSLDIDSDEDFDADEEDDEDLVDQDPNGRRLSALFAQSGLMLNNLIGCQQQQKQNPTNQTPVCDNPSSSPKKQKKNPCFIQSFIGNLTCGVPLTSEAIVSFVFHDTPKPGTSSNTSTSSAVDIPTDVGSISGSHKFDDDYPTSSLHAYSASPDIAPLSADDIRRNLEMEEADKRNQELVADANRRWNEAMEKPLEKSVEAESAASHDGDIFDFDDAEEEDQVDCPNAENGSSLNFESKKKNRTLRFSSDPPEVFDTDAQADCRAKYWEYEAHYRMRDEKEREEEITRILDPAHRARIYKERFQEPSQ